MKKEKHYVAPEAEILRLQFDDIISTSGNDTPSTNDPHDKDIGEWDDEM